MSDFERIFGHPPQVATSAPGRVNLIGEHTDYNGGFVLPMPIPQLTRVWMSPRAGRRVRVASVTLSRGAPIAFELGHEHKRGDWLDYVQGIVVVVRGAGLAVDGFDALISSEVPVGAGLSSSAALEIALLRALDLTFALGLDPVEVARLGRRAENEFVGAPVGIMDQMASSLGAQGSALFIDTRALAYERVPLPRGIEWGVIDSGSSHAHAHGGYAERRRECERAAQLLGVPELRDVSSLERVAALPAPLERRARHVVSENARVLETVRAIRASDTAAVGRNLNASHTSLRDDFEVSTPEVDRLVELAQAHPDVLGARMTGGGFGGAVVLAMRRVRAGAAAREVHAAFVSEGYERARVLVPSPIT